mmetsp:Transcript_18563/g.34828  ORF Transcript_18563/g.34828 Transcript_18563/m.34828 type:complete len:147 (+) Transcript_18563:67-507(+)
MSIAQPFFAMMLLFGSAESSAVQIPGFMPNITNTSADPADSAHKMQWSSMIELLASAGFSAADLAIMKATAEGCVAFEQLDMVNCVLEKCNQQWPEHEHFIMLLGPGYFFPQMSWEYGRKTRAEQYAVYKLRTTGDVRLLIQVLHL